MYSTRGRPRKLTDAQVQAILEWHRNRKPLRQFALEMGLSKATINHVIQRKGQYKQPSPELRQEVLMARRARFKAMASRGWL